MQIGDLVQCTEPIGLARIVGLIVKIIPPKHAGSHTMDSYEVLTDDGKLRVYTSAAVRALDGNR